MWMYVYDDAVFVDVDVYIESQPVSFDQVKDVVTSLNQPVNAYIDVSRVDLTEIDFIGLVNIIWELHDHTRDKNILNKMYFTGASRVVRSVWSVIQYAMPSFVRQCVVFKY